MAQRITVTIADHSDKAPIELGHQGENLATTVEFDISAWMDTFGDGTAMLLNQRKGETPYIVNVTQDGTAVFWTVTNIDTGKAGSGWCELQYYVGDVLVKSDKWRTITKESLEDAGDTPEPWEGFIDQVVNLVATAEDARDEAQEAAEAAEASLDKQPYPNAETKTWWRWDSETGGWVDTGEGYGGDYSSLANKPSINGVELTGNKSFEQLGEQTLSNTEIAAIVAQQYKIVFGGN